MINILDPTFIGTNESVDFNEFIQENLRTALNSQNWRMDGALVVQFNVSPTGNLSEFQVIESVSPEYDYSVIVHWRPPMACGIRAQSTIVPWPWKRRWSIMQKTSFNYAALSIDQIIYCRICYCIMYRYRTQGVT
jgi:hypothetical protein